MKNSKEKDYQHQIRVLSFLIVLLYLIVLAQPFIFIYLLQYSNIRIVSPDIEERFIKSEKTKDNVNYNPTPHQVEKREISSVVEKECGNNCLLQSKTCEKDDDSVTLNGKCNIKKPDLCEYCFTAEDFCKKNITELKGKKENENGDSKEKNGQTKHCTLDNITYHGTFPFTRFYKDVIFSSRQFEEDSEGSLKILIKEEDRPILKEYKLHKDENYELVKTIALPDRTKDFGYIYNGSYYSRHRYQHKVVKYNFETGESTTGEKLRHIPGYDALVFRLDQNYIWIFNLINLTLDTYEAVQTNPEDLQVLSQQNIKQNYCFIRNQFVAFGKIYCLSDGDKLKVYLLSDLNEKKNSHITDSEEVYIDREEEFHLMDVFYNFKERQLYLTDRSYVTRNYTIHSYKLHFNCSYEE
ncbi:uncharacterized protein LOC111641113 [Centruroides sculpturatus]|uniref:uncharacterized protein LOC111641113 n=1 Tax=Centruroides sculpturatus TaxID=218467 RepID=UPI000C6CA60E|nr:uncharacterized protein LOC111641113 [Centruroides sculpturatus]